MQCENQEMSEVRIWGQKLPGGELVGEGAKLSLKTRITPPAIEFVFTDNLWLVYVKI